MTHVHEHKPFLFHEFSGSLEEKMLGIKLQAAASVFQNRNGQVTVNSLHECPAIGENDIRMAACLLAEGISYLSNVSETIEGKQGLITLVKDLLAECEMDVKNVTN